MRSGKSSEHDSDTEKRGRWRENIEAILVAIVIALFIRTFVVQAFKIPSGSMKQTLQIGDHILVNKFIYGLKIPYWRMTLVPVKSPETGDVIVFRPPHDPDKDFIKRVVGVGGDVVESRNKQLYINQKPVKHDFAVYSEYAQNVPKRDNFGPVTVPENALFVMGDNRDESYDSRFWGFVDLKEVSGKAFIIYWSWDKENFGVRWERLARLLK